MPPTTHQPSPPDPFQQDLNDGLAASDPEPVWIVQKYGGTSVGKQLATISNVIAPSYLATPNVRLAIVCSARSGHTKALGTTNLLLQAAKEALQVEEESDAQGSPDTQSLSNSVSSLANGNSHSHSSSAFSRNGRGLSRTGSSLLSGNQARRSEGASLSSTNLDSRLKGLSMEKGEGEGAATPPVATGYNATVDKIMNDHLEAVRLAVTKNVEARDRLESDIVEDCEKLRDFLMAAKIIEEISPRSKDIIMSIGERLSCRIVVGSLIDAGINAELVGMENIVDSAFLEELANSGAKIDAGGSRDDELLDQAFYDLLSVKMSQRLKSVKSVPVVTGYFGNVPGSLLSQVGRGYTDLCAALCAVGLKASELQIWKEVDGVFTADPRKVSTARLIPAITPEEAAELTYYGSEVIHPFTMEQAIKKAVPIRIKNVENPSGGGTVIFPPAAGSKEEGHELGGLLKQPTTPGVSSGTNTPWGSNSTFLTPSHMSGGEPLRPRKSPTAVTIKEDIWILNVHSNRKTISHGFFAKIFSTLDKYGVIVDLISTSEVHVSMALHSSQSGLMKLRTLEKLKVELGHLGQVSILKEMTILSLVGTQMRNMVGVSGKMFTTLAEGNINIEMISQGANEINISCVIAKRSALKALNLIHYSVSNKVRGVSCFSFQPMLITMIFISFVCVSLPF
jgi:aspartate kinase